MRTRHSYDTSVILLYATGREHLLPFKFRKKIPYTTISTWRKADSKRYIGYEFRYFFDEAFDNMELRADYERLRNSVWSFARTWVLMRDLLFPMIKAEGNDKKTQQNILDAIHFLKNSVGLRRALKLLGLSYTQYRQWAIEAKFDCFDSYTSVCAKLHPNQLALEEVKKMKYLLTRYEHDHWPIVSVASHGMRTGKMVASLYTWYKYARLLGITKKPIVGKRKKVGLVATYANEYWHVDTTEYSLTDGRKVWIAFVMDNFSRRILGFHVMENRTFALVKRAIKNALKIASMHPGPQQATMIADGGSENHNRNIHEFLDNMNGFKITKLRSLKDIQFSNSPVEVINRTMKGRYLRTRKFETIKSMRQFLDWAVHDYNEVRPHYKHYPRTPHEVYFNIPLKFDMKKRKQKAYQQRLKTNRCVNCMQCTGVDPQRIEPPKVTPICPCFSLTKRSFPPLFQRANLRCFVTGALPKEDPQKAVLFPKFKDRCPAR